MHRVTACKAEDDYKLWIRFDDGLEGSVFLGKKIATPDFKYVAAKDGVAPKPAPQPAFGAAGHGASIGMAGFVAPGTFVLARRCACGDSRLRARPYSGWCSFSRSPCTTSSTGSTCRPCGRCPDTGHVLANRSGRQGAARRASGAPPPPSACDRMQPPLRRNPR